MSNCFKGEFKVTTQAPMGKAELKKLRAQLMDEFPGLSKRMVDKVLPPKEDVNILKCSNGTQLFVAGDSPPAFFDDGFGGVFPTLFTLWRLPNIMPELITHGPVSKYLIPKANRYLHLVSQTPQPRLYLTLCHPFVPPNPTQTDSYYSCPFLAISAPGLCACTSSPGALLRG
uniref:Pre-PUA domain-containing protein n=1 Tax=Haptolina ericina TaxID=156174 RepID=A0A7S3BE50_9EUKA